MTGAEILLDRFDLLTSEPGTVLRLRRLMLELAVRGRLATSEPSDEPAGELVNRIQSAKGRLFRKPLVLEERDHPFPVPDDWAWVSFNSVADHRLGKMLDKRKNTGELRPYLRNVNVRWFGFDLSDIKEMRITSDEVRKYSVRPGDLLICEGGEPGRCAVWNRDEPLAFQKALHRARPRGGVSPHYLGLVLESAANSGRLAGNFTGATISHLTGRSLAALPVPLPPIEEQQRIVDQVALCDRLADGLRQSREAAERLLGATLEGALG